MKKILLAVIAMSLLAPAFALSKKKKKNVKSPITSVTLHRTACYGKCPEYTITLHKDGTVTYTGIRNVPDSGTYKKNIGSAKTMAIINELIGYKVDTCSKMYNNRIPDLPGIMYTINYKDSVKKIYSAEWGPTYLKKVAAEIDGVGKKTDNSWKKAK